MLGATSHLPPKSSILVNCPVDVLVTDATGKRAGVLSNGTEIQEFSAYFYRTVESNETLGWYFGVFEGVYDILITGKSTGTFNMMISGEAAGNQVLSYGDQSILEGDQARITIGASTRPLLYMPDGSTVEPEVIEVTINPSQTPTSSPEDGGFSLDLLVIIVIVVIIAIVAVALLVLWSRKPKKPMANWQPLPPPPPPP